MQKRSFFLESFMSLLVLFQIQGSELYTHRTDQNDEAKDDFAENFANICFQERAQIFRTMALLRV